MTHGALLALALTPLSALAATLSGNVHAPGRSIVYVTGYTKITPGKRQVVTQKDERFEPGFVAIGQGQSVAFANRDTKSHNVFSVSEARKFDLGIAEPGSVANVTFPEAGLVDVFCNIHPKMEGRVLVLPNPSFAVTSDKGAYKITDIPDGTFRVFAWNPKGKPVSKELEFKKDANLKMDWEIEAENQEPHLNKYGRPYREKKKY